MTTTRVRILSFAEIESPLLYEILRLRAEVFVVEQVCPYQDLDGRDHKARHVLALADGKLLACARILADERGLWIGRIAVSPERRGEGLGRLVVEAALAALADDPRPRLMNAQAQLEDFYARFGFARVGAPFLEDGIPHILMRRQA